MTEKRKKYRGLATLPCKEGKSRSLGMNNAEVQLVQRHLDDLKKVHAYLG